tara:strand:+ start:70 stop:471 length:402 start_codon:yes stop_codon:yes gene_type:complete
LPDRALFFFALELSSITHERLHLEFSELALEKIGEIALEHDSGDKALRLRVLGGGCAGFSYDLLFEDDSLPEDQVFEFGGRQVIVDPESYGLVRGLRVEYVNELTTEGFRFHNPNSVAVCGCGTSFAVDSRER